jgi:hypothetical protein
MPAPKVFLSHASEDKQRFVIPFATSLRGKGIDVWLDKWEILPGDSLVDKLFEEGLKQAGAVLIVISAVSVTKPWVRQELNTAIVNRITRQTKVIPIILDKLDKADIPEALRSLVWESIPDLNNYGAQLDKVVDAIYGHHRDKPALGKPPDYLNERPIPGLHESDTRILRAIYEDAIKRNRPIWGPEEFSSKLEGMSQEVVLDSLEILEQRGYIKIGRVMGGVPRGIGLIQPRLNGFMVFARANLPQIDEMIRKVALAILNENLESASLIAESTRIAPFIVDNLLDLFASRGWAKISNTLADKHLYGISASMKREFT